MTHFDVFNGDADGLCALHQLRMAEPVDSLLITGAKRDIRLLERITAVAGDRVTALDISLDVNRAALTQLLDRGVEVQYFDHHFSGDIPLHAGLHAHLDPRADVCTSMLVDIFLQGRYRIWAVVAAFGDNLHGTAKALASSLALSTAKLEQLRELGECLNYNAYGDCEADLFMHPAEVYKLLRTWRDPFVFMHEAAIFRELSAARISDLQQAVQSAPFHQSPTAAIYVLPDTAWARRVRGPFGNHLAKAAARRAHAILTPRLLNTVQGYTVSVRAPLATLSGAESLCRRFPTGGGRAAAAGIDFLPSDALPQFISAFVQAFH